MGHRRAGQRDGLRDPRQPALARGGAGPRGHRGGAAGLRGGRGRPAHGRALPRPRGLPDVLNAPGQPRRSPSPPGCATGRGRRPQAWA
ncbi:DNA-directed RNA polymerase III 31 kDa polypeptide [Actinacidiphila bryophytorum]|uniref:DNA-directed RNA polymerase III 31 kDa polypeptide n=1 Tax=Actinacidiphila bryophytorum TaxID=1436133 RepID=A0A9W4H4R7_9ACTN|nr:DNA-directed RNA polymerase III 31 kDa polypeptide [Actinacidiphila bryophytorum]